jgi:formylmethanofuran dehydrogenase subunit C
MSRLTLTLREPPAQRVDMGAFTPDRLAGLSAEEVRRIPLWQGRRQVPAGDLFQVEGTDTQQILIRAESDRLDGIGTGMTRGVILVEGQAGAYLGREMRGGTIRVTGNSGILAGTAMSGGQVQIEGSCGDFLGAALPGERGPMRGGLLLVHGNAGDRVGDSLRRGIILIAGNAGDYCASRMGAGTVAVLGAVGIQVGLGMRRGSVLLTAEPRLPPTFNDNGIHHLGFLRLLTQSPELAADPFAALRERGTRVRRWLGDLGYGGKGEVLVWS